jgi:hypothetical protein
VRDTAIAVDILDDAGKTTGVRFLVMHPVLGMESRVHNVAGLADAYDTERGRTQLLRLGATRSSIDGCNSCTCAQSGQVACTLIACAPGPDAALSDGGCVGPPPSNGCNACVCTAGNWICGVQQCPPGDASRSDGPPMSSDASASDGPTLPRDASTDAPARVVCGSVICGLGEWCDTSGATPTCRCGPTGGSCSTGLECCVNPFSGCGGAHCNERCLAKDDAGAAYTCP